MGNSANVLFFAGYKKYDCKELSFKKLQNFPEISTLYQ